MRLEIVTNEERSPFVMSDLGARRAEILELNAKEDHRVRIIYYNSLIFYIKTQPKAISVVL